ncbi:hypothetical protein PMIN06_012095 [Paraphaeosphaeria minitans]|uniref:DUF7730 domain-containing protein n=1 Tax=Paraphaeosphaeria minitans TaxID=565426 RepID=A0A9P6KQF4_9PLEO|nr:hypothetical protein PMIN01_05628 [Paraphaeosphaeria minitans]
MVRYNLRAHPKPAASASGIQKRTKPAIGQEEKKMVSLHRGLLSLQESSMRFESATHFNSLDCPLLRLPAEVRTKIFEYVLVSEKPVLVYWDDIRGIIQRPYSLGVQQCLCLGRLCLVRLCLGRLGLERLCLERLCLERGPCQFFQSSNFFFERVCRQIYNEASMIYYARNTFHVKCRLVNTFADSLLQGHRHELRHLGFPAIAISYELFGRRDPRQD